MTQQYQTPKKYFYTPTSNNSKVMSKETYHLQQQTVPVDQYLNIERSIIQNNRNKLRSLLQQQKKLLGKQPNTTQFSPITKYSSLPQSQYKNINKINKFSLSTSNKQQSQVKTVFIRNDPQISQSQNYKDDNMMLKKISDKMKGIIKNQSQNKKPIYFTKDYNIEMNHQIKNLIEQNTILRQQNQQYLIANRQKSKKIEQLTKQLLELKILFEQKQENHHKFVLIKNTQIQNVQKYYQFQMKKTKQNLEQLINNFWERIVQKMEFINVNNMILRKKIGKCLNKITQFENKFKVQKQIFYDTTHRKIKNISQISPIMPGDIQLEEQQKQKLQIQQQIIHQKNQFQNQKEEWNNRYRLLQQGFLQLKRNNLFLLQQLQSMRVLDQTKIIKQKKIYSSIQIQTENANMKIYDKINQECNTIKLDQRNQKQVKNLQQQIKNLRDQLQMLNKYFCQQMQKTQAKQQQIKNLRDQLQMLNKYFCQSIQKTQAKQQQIKQIKQSLIQNFKKKPNLKQLAMTQNLAKKQRKQKNIAYIKLASLQKQLQTAKKINQLYEEELSEHLEQVAEEFTEQEKANLKISGENAGLQWQKVIKHKLKSILQQIKQIQNNQNILR